MSTNSKNTGDLALDRLSARVGRILLKKGRTVATAESCTGGFIAKVLTDTGGSSRWFVEGFVVYSNAAKVSRLGISLAALRKYGAVSESIARAMVAAALKRSGSDLAVSVTGIAGPGGAVPGKPVGTVFIGWAMRRGNAIRIRVTRKRFRGDRDTVRRKTVRVALLGLMR